MLYIHGSGSIGGSGGSENLCKALFSRLKVEEINIDPPLLSEGGVPPPLLSEGGGYPPPLKRLRGQYKRGGDPPQTQYMGLPSNKTLCKGSREGLFHWKKDAL